MGAAVGVAFDWLTGAGAARPPEALGGAAGSEAGATAAATVVVVAATLTCRELVKGGRSSATGTASAVETCISVVVETLLGAGGCNGGPESLPEAFGTATAVRLSAVMRAGGGPDGSGLLGAEIFFSADRDGDG